MKFNRGKSVRDPIYLRKQANDFWMEGDIYEQFCKCLDQIFKGHKNYFVNGFSPKAIDFSTNIAYYKINVTDQDGDTHTFFGRVVDSDEFDVSQRGGNFRCKDVEEVPSMEAPPPEAEVKDEEVGEQSESDAQSSGEQSEQSDPDAEKSITLDEFNAIKEEMTREMEIETVNAEFGDQLTNEKDSDKLLKKRTARKNRDERGAKNQKGRNKNS